jgi:hypothetical protein
MSGNSIFTSVGRDALVQHVVEHVVKFRLGEGGFVKSGLITELIDSGAVGGEDNYTYTITGGDFSIIAVNQGTKVFTVTGDQRQYLAVDSQVIVMESTGNNGRYTVVSTALNGSDTDITVYEAIPDSTADGQLYVSKLPILKRGMSPLPAENEHHHPMAVVEYHTSVDPGNIVQKFEDLNGNGTLTQTIGGSGTGTVNYKTGALDVTFENPVASGNIVTAEYKYANVPKQPLESKSILESQGDAALFTFEKDLSSGDFSFKGTGWATVRATAFLSESEGIDDGDSYGGTPYYFEGGLFDENDVLLCYFTFDKQRKLGSATITHQIDYII